MKNNKGTTLLELLVAVSIFVVVITMAMNIGQSIIESLRNAVSAQITQENIRFALEVMGKEIRNATVMDTSCDNAFKDIQIFYKINGTEYSKSALGLNEDYYSANKVFNVVDQDKNNYNKKILLFKNKEGECVSYSFFPDLKAADNINTKIIMITRTKITEDGEGGESYRHRFDTITSGLIAVKELNFLVEDNIIGVDPRDRIQPRATIKMQVEMESGTKKHLHTTDIQTTVSSRFYY